MEPVERLAAYLADELPADERVALEAELARDEALRAQLAAMRRADAALAAEPATSLPDGARERLLATVTPVLDEVLGRPEGRSSGRAAAGVDRDELSARRRRRAANRRSWAMGLGGVAAAIVAIAVVVPSLGGSGGNDAAEVAADAPMTNELSTDQAGDSGAAETEASDDVTAFAAPVGPTLLGSDRTLDLDAIEDLLAAGELDAVVARDLATDDAIALADAWLAAYGADEVDLGTARTQADSPATEDAATEPFDADVPLEDEAGESAGATPGAADGSVEFGRADLQLLGDVDAAAREDVARCLAVLDGSQPLFVPVLAELVTFEGGPAVAFAVATRGDGDRLTTREVWVVARDTCEVLHVERR